uniref:Olfactory receptor n=1 Tax=Equus asinus TaxID=9793 RepID=A0A8C4KWC1_EQUAS
MEPVNRTEVSEFFLKGFSGYPALERLLFPLCSVVYLVTLLGNTAILVVSVLDSHLHTPMYFFLGNLSILDIWYTSTFVPLMLVHLLSARKTISFLGCTIQMCLSLSTGSTECLLLAIMAYDRYLAICWPLRHPVIMSHQLCLLLAGAAWRGAGSAVSLLQATLPWSLPFCGRNILNHFFCEVLVVLKLACGDISLNVLLLMVATAILMLAPLLLTCLSHISILAAILRVPSAAGQRRAFSTCSAHLTVVVVFYRTTSFTYFEPKAKDPYSDKIIPLLHGLMTRSLNPITYSLRKAEVRTAATALPGRDPLSTPSVFSFLHFVGAFHPVPIPSCFACVVFHHNVSSLRAGFKQLWLISAAPTDLSL